jgi:dihydropteroate synthase
MQKDIYLSRINSEQRPLVMGILNITPDSFSDGGCFIDPQSALLQASKMLKDGADIIDLGGESTRPGAGPVDSKEQLRRILPVMNLLRSSLSIDCLLSVDTTQSNVAEKALQAGVDIVNDISAGLHDPRMFSMVAERSVPIVLMHMQGTPFTMQNNPVYTNVVEEVAEFLIRRAELAEKTGIKRENIILDPGIGFGKRQIDNLKLIAQIRRIVDIGYTVLLGTSRKRFMGSICGEKEAVELLGATIATTVYGVEQGVKIFRVHDVKPNRQAVDVTVNLMRNRIE